MINLTILNLIKPPLSLSNGGWHPMDFIGIMIHIIVTVIVEIIIKKFI